MPKKFHNNVSEAVQGDYHNAFEKFGSKNPDDPDDPGTLDDGVDIGPHEQYDDDKTQQIEQELNHKNILTEHLDETALIAEEKGAEEISRHNQLIFNILFADVSNDLADLQNSESGHTGSNSERLQQNNITIDILADIYGSINTQNDEDIKTINSILEERLDNYHKQIEFFSSQYVNSGHAQMADKKAKITEGLIVQVGKIESEFL